MQFLSWLKSGVPLLNIKMDDLLKNRARAANDAKRIKRKQKRKELVTYTIKGRAMRGRLSKGKKCVITTLSVFLTLLVFVYVPPLFYRAPSENSYVPITPNAQAIKTYQTYLKDNPDLDFDDDGLDNSLEGEYGTDVWSVDTDGDGVSDYAELFLTETSPTEASSIMIEQMMNDDEKNGDTLGTPYKIDDIIFWPDTYQAKSYGAVVRTLQGYRFCNYTGWVRFPEKVYAYGYNNGTHYELTHREQEDAWKIDTDDEILLYEEPLTFVHCLKLPFIKPIYLQDNVFGRLLTDILPNQGGFVNCHKASTLDIQKDDKKTVTATLRSPLIDKENHDRFGHNMNTLKDLAYVRKLIEAGECVAVSLYSGNAGESIGIVYGYTDNGDLMIADESLNPVGLLTINESAMRMMDKEGTLGQIAWYEFKGLGFDSLKYGDRISFFSTTMTSVDDTAALEPESEVIIENENNSGSQPKDETPLTESEKETTPQTEEVNSLPEKNNEETSNQTMSENNSTEIQTEAPVNQSESGVDSEKQDAQPQTSSEQIENNSGQTEESSHDDMVATFEL